MGSVTSRSAVEWLTALRSELQRGVFSARSFGQIDSVEKSDDGIRTLC